MTAHQLEKTRLQSPATAYSSQPKTAKMVTYSSSTSPVPKDLAPYRYTDLRLLRVGGWSVGVGVRLEFRDASTRKVLRLRHELWQVTTDHQWSRQFWG